MEHITNEQLNEKLEAHIKKHDEDFSSLSNMWWKIGGVVLIPFLVAVYGYGVLNDQVNNLKENLSSKANKETVESQLTSINIALVDIKATLVELNKKK